MWRLTTYLVGLAWLIYGAKNFDYPDWDIGVSLVMSISTLFTAKWVWRTLTSKSYYDWPLAFFFTWWCVDGSYTIYWTLVNKSVMMRGGQWPMSLCLYLLCGAIWQLSFADLKAILALCRDSLLLAVQKKRE